MALVQVKGITIEELPPPKPGEVFIPAPAPKWVKAGPLAPEEARALLPPQNESGISATRFDDRLPFLSALHAQIRE